MSNRSSLLTTDTALISASDRWAFFAGRRVLLLQGPHGPFFKRVRQALEAAGATLVLKVNFNGGDWLFNSRASINYRGSADEWPTWLDQLVSEHQIDSVLVFGDCRPVHRVARRIAHERGLAFWTFEEGYVRPNFITFEPHGVNGNSKLPADADFYAKWKPIALPIEREVENSFWHAAVYSIAYFGASILARPWFSKYQHHRRISWIDALCWMRALSRKWTYRWKERHHLRDLRGYGGKRPYFLQVLQVSTDAQVHYHSRFSSIEEFISEVVASFAQFAPADAVLLVKHHPLDRGYTDYAQLLAALSAQHRLGDRLRYIHDQHLPTLMANARGLVTINSTVGLSGLTQGLSVKVLGQAIYDIPGLTSQSGLEKFWTCAEQDKPDPDLLRRFINYVIATTQINGNFYKSLPHSDLAGLGSRQTGLDETNLEISPHRAAQQTPMTP